MISNDKGRRDHTLTPAIPGPTSGVHFRPRWPPAVLAKRFRNSEAAIRCTLHGSDRFFGLIIPPCLVSLATGKNHQLWEGLVEKGINTERL